MSILIRDAGVWKENDPWVRDGGVWKPVDTGFVRDGGVWKEMFSSGPPAIGEPYEGGYYAGLIQVGAVTYALIVAPISLGETTTSWGQTGVTGATSFEDGLANTTHLVTSGGSYPAAQFCSNLSIDGHNDWYLPSINELSEVYNAGPSLPSGERPSSESYYWSSTQSNSGNARRMLFSNGNAANGSKSANLQVRAVRRVPLS